MDVINYLDISLEEASAMHCVLPFFLWQHKLKMENSCSRTQILNIKMSSAFQELICFINVRPNWRPFTYLNQSKPYRLTENTS